MSELPFKLWECVAIDFYGPFLTKEFAQVVIDEMEIVTSTSMAAVPPLLDKIFAIHGIPNIVKSDNGSLFDSDAFEDYAQEKGFIRKPVTLLWPEGNRLVERFMQPLVKSATASAVEGHNWKNEIYTFIANYRATPHSATNVMPHQLLINRSVKVKLLQVSMPASDLHVIAKKHRIKVYADSHRNVKPHSVKV